MIEMKMHKPYNIDMKNSSKNNKIKVYLDTSVLSYLDQQDSPEKMAETIEVWELIKQNYYDIYISDVVLNEINQCTETKLKTITDFLNEIDYTVLSIDEDTVDLALKIIEEGILAQKSIDDCRHIAAAIRANCDVIVSWNFKHIVNVKTIRGIKVITTMEGYKDILIYPPTALLNEEGDGER